MIDNEVSSTQSAYNSAKTTFTNAQTDFNNKVTAANNTRNAKDSTAGSLDSARIARDNAQTTYNNAVNYYNSLANDDPNKQAAYNAMVSAQSNLSTAQTNYNNALSAYNTAVDNYNTAVTNLNTSKSNFDTAANNLLTASTNYGTALARRQMFTDAQSSGTISSQISGLSSQTVPSDSGFEGLTTDAYQNIQSANSAKETARNNLLAAFNNYRYVEWQIANTRTEIFKQQALYQYSLATGGSFDSTYLNSLNSTLSNLVNNQRPSASSTLDSALSNYSSKYNAVDSELLNAISAARTQAENWSSFVASKQQVARDHIDSLLSASQSQDTSSRTQHLNTYQSTNSTYTGSMVGAQSSAYASHVSTILSSGAGNVAVDASGIPILPQGNRVLSISQLMDLISSVQLMIDELTRQMGDADQRINSFRREINQNEVDYYVKNRMAQDAWARVIYQADIAYNEQVDSDNIETYTRITNIYKAYQQNVSVINGVIDQVNAEIDQQNAKNKALVNAANAINPEVVKAINAANKNKPETANTLDYANQDTDLPTPGNVNPRTALTYPPDIPHYPRIDASSFPAPPTANYNVKPPQFPTQAQIDAFNNAVVNISNKIAPFSTRVQNALMQSISGSTVDASTLDLQKLYLRASVTPRDNLVKSTYDGFFAFIFAFSQQLSAMSSADADRDENRKTLVAAIFQRVDALLTSSIVEEPAVSDGTSVSNTVGGGVSFTTADLKAKPSAVGRLINQIATSEQFTAVLQALFERIGIQAGLQAAGSLPEAAKLLSSLGIPVQELLAEQGIDASKLLEQQNTQALVAAFIGQLAAASMNTTGLQAAAIEILDKTPAVKALSPEELKEALAALVALLQTLLLLLAAFLGVGAGFSPQEILSGFGESTPSEKTVTTILQKTGLPEEKIAAIVGALGPQLETLLPLFQALNIDSQTQGALLLLLGAREAGISLTEGVPGGKAFLAAILQKVKEGGGIDLPKDITSDAFLNRLVQGLEVKADTLQADQIKLDVLRDSIRTSLLNRQNRIDDQRRLSQLESPRDTVRDTRSTSTNTNTSVSLDTAFTTSASQFTTASPFTSSTTQTSSVSFSDTSNLQTTAPTVNTSTPAPVSANDILNQVRNDYKDLPSRVKDSLRQEASSKLSSVTEVSIDDKAAILNALVSRSMTPDEASAFLTLLSIQAAASIIIEASTLANDLVQKLFQKSPEQIRSEEDARQYEAKTEDIRQKFERPATLPKQTREIMREAFEMLSRNFSDEKYASVLVTSFVQTIEKMSNFNKIAVDYLLDPGKSILREFSIITRSSGDRSKQSPIILGG